jgi:hypothetical protein
MPKIVPRKGKAAADPMAGIRGVSGPSADAMLAARGGMSRSDLRDDMSRESSSPLGHGMGSRGEPRRKRGK